MTENGETSKASGVCDIEPASTLFQLWPFGWEPLCCQCAVAECHWSRARRQTASTPLSYFSSPKLCPREDSVFLSRCLSMKLIPSSPDGLTILADNLQTQLLSGESSLAAAVKKPKRFCRVSVVCCFIIKLNVPPFFLPPAVLSKAGKRQLVIADKCFMNLNRLDY